MQTVTSLLYIFTLINFGIKDVVLETILVTPAVRSTCSDKSSRRNNQHE